MVFNKFHRRIIWRFLFCIHFAQVQKKNSTRKVQKGKQSRKERVTQEMKDETRDTIGKTRLPT